MNKNLTRVLSVSLLALFLYSCSASNPNIESAKQNLQHKDYQKAIASLNQAIAQDSTDAEAYYYKGYVYSKMASQDSLDQRAEAYKKMRENYDKAKQLYNKQGKGGTKELTIMRMSTVRMWTNEHNSAVHLAANDSTRKPGDLNKAVDHLHNAIAISPDSLISYEVLAEVYNMQGKTDQAENVLSDALSKSSKPPVNDYLRLAQFYQKSKKYDQSVKVLNEAKKDYPDNVKITQSLANTYLAMNDDKNAIAAVKTLISTDSTNVQYHLVYGTELYKLAMTMNDTLSSRYDRVFALQQKQQKNNTKKYQSTIDELQNSNQKLASNIEDLTGKAITQLKYVVNHRPNDPTAYNTLGVIYRNKAAALLQLRNNTNDLQKSDSLDTAAKSALKKALPYYQKATQLDPNNKNYWQSLFKVYTVLGMNKKAEEAMKKAGLD